METLAVDHSEGVGDAELFARLYPSLRRFAAVTGGSDQDPDDLVQEAVSRSLRRQPLSSLDDPGAYLRRAIVNLASNHRRSMARWRRAVSRIGPSDEGRGAEYPTDLDDLRRLSPTDRALLYLVEVEGVAYAAAGGLLELSEEAARARASRARTRLRAELTAEMDVDGPPAAAAGGAIDG